MGINTILEAVRSKLGVGAEVPNSVALIKELGVQEPKLKRLDKDIETINKGLALAQLRPGGVKADTDRLARLEGERKGVQALIDSLRTEITTALETEHAAALQTQWDEAQRLGDALIVAAQKVDAAAIVVAEALAGPLEELRAVHTAFRSALPDGYGTNYRYATDIARDGVGAALDAIGVRVGNDESRIKKMQSLATIAKDEVYGRTLGNPSQPTERLKPPPRDHLGRRINELNQVVEG